MKLQLLGKWNESIKVRGCGRGCGRGKGAMRNHGDSNMTRNGAGRASQRNGTSGSWLSSGIGVNMYQSIRIK